MIFEAASPSVPFFFQMFSGNPVAAGCTDQYMICLAEHYPGLAGWVGAIGSTLALLAALGIFILQVKRESSSRRQVRLVRLDIIEEVIADYEMCVSESYEKARGAEQPQSDVFILGIPVDPTWLACVDLTKINIIDWPSLTAYKNFRAFWQYDSEASADYQTLRLNRFPEPTADIIWTRFKHSLAMRDQALNDLRKEMKLARSKI